MSRRLIDRDTVSGVSTFMHYDGVSDVIHFEHVQDAAMVEAMAEANRTEFNTFSSGRDKWGDYAKVAHIPVVQLSELMSSGKLWDKAYMKRYLNDPSNAWMRTRPGVL